MRRRFHFIWRYWRGDVPWDSGIVPPEILSWLETTQASGTLPGRALDLGCGTGTTSIELAARGWTVVGVDFAPNAIRRARRKARTRTLTGSAEFHSADVARPDLLAGRVPFDLVIDVGCLHGLTADRRPGYATNLIRLTRPGATFLLYAFLPSLSHDGRRWIGIDGDALRALLGPAFEIASYTPGEDVCLPRPSVWYTLRRVEPAS